MLDFRFGINRKTNKSSYNGVLDSLDIVNNLKLGFSNKKLTKNYSDIAYTIVRNDDDSEQDFYYNNSGNVPVDNINSWLNGSIGLAKKWGNQGNENYFAYQNNKINMPVFSNEGLVFNGTSKYMIIDNYSDLEIINPEISIYTNFLRNSSHIGFVFSRNTSESSDIQYSALNFNETSAAWFNGGSVISDTNQENNKDLISWVNKLSSGFKLNTNGNESVTTLNVTLTNQNYTQIGARKTAAGYTTYFNGTIKDILLFDKDVYGNYNEMIQL